MLRRQLLTALLVTVALIVLLGIVYPLVVTGVAQIAFPDRANGSLIKRNDQVIGSSLIGQNFTDKNGNPDLHYFQPRPSAAGANGYDPTASGASSLGPSNPKLIGTCNPVPDTDANGKPKVDAEGNPVNKKNPDGSLVCDPGTVPQRAAAYRKAYGLGPGVLVPVDAVTASASGLDPDISVANAMIQAPVVARNRGLPVQTVLNLVNAHTNGRQLAVLGEKTVNVLDLNLALDRIR